MPAPVPADTRPRAGRAGSPSASACCARARRSDAARRPRARRTARTATSRGLPTISAATIRRWIEAQTFSPRAGEAGVHLVDATAARFGIYDDVHLVGLVDGEWPAVPRRNLFYSPMLLQPLGWPPDSARVACGAGRRSSTCCGSPRQRTAVSAFQLEEDSLVAPSALLDDVGRAGLQPLARADDRTPIFSDRGACSRARPSPACSRWPPRRGCGLRLARTDAADAAFHGTAHCRTRRARTASAPSSCTRTARSSTSPGTCCASKRRPTTRRASRRANAASSSTKCSRRFFDRWQMEGGGTITAARPGPRARALLEEVMAPRLAALGRSDAALERTRLLGSPVAPGLADLVLRMEAERAGTGARTAARGEVRRRVRRCRAPRRPRQVPIRGVVDRIDLLDGRHAARDRLQVVAAARPPLQLAIYARDCAQRLRGHRGRHWTRRRSGLHRVQRLAREVHRPDCAASEPQALRRCRRPRFVGRDRRDRGWRVPAAAGRAALCSSCAYAGVCRKDYVAEIEDVDTTPAV